MATLVPIKTNGARRKQAASTRKANGAARKAGQPAKAKGGAYDAFKEFEGQRYTGMKIGRGHKWHYDPGQWTEKKVTPDKWEFSYAVTKRRAGKAPEGSGVPVGTEYHWYILAHQTARKVDANSYTTDMAGLKYKLAHKRADKETWSASDSARRRRLIKILKDMIKSLEQESAQGATPDAVRHTTARKPSKRRKRAVRPREKHLVAA